jgi:triacylglycerol lipase
MKWLRRGFCTWLDYLVAGWWELRSFFVRSAPARWQQGGLRPVLLLPGVYEPWHFLRTIGDHLNAAGHPVHVVPEIRYNIDSISDVAAFAQRYVDSHDLREVALVGHSKGGLVGKHMMAFDDTDHRIACLAAIVTPFGGSTMARFMVVRTLRAFLPTDATISTLAANLALNSRITSIYGEFDPQIPGGSWLDGAVNVQLPIVGHFRLLADERVIRAVENAVSGTD